LGEIFFEKETCLEKNKTQIWKINCEEKNQSEWSKNIFLEQNIEEEISKKVPAKNYFSDQDFYFCWEVFLEKIKNCSKKST